MTRGVILFGHGSRDPLWRRPIEAVAQRVAARDPALLVRCAYLELTTPDLPTAAADLIDAGARAITITPMFLGAGRHVREDLPGLVQDLKARWPTVAWTLRAPVGENEELLELLARIALE